MKRVPTYVAAAVATGFSTLIAAAPLTVDPLTSLPLIPATKPPFGDNGPTELPSAQICKSQMRGNYYAVFNTKVSVTVSWYASRLPGFQKTHAFVSGRSQDTFYSADGTTIVSVTGDPGKDGEDATTYSVAYERLQPGLSAKTIIGINQQKIVCN